jgi:outer membrane lipoprotein SlyB
MTSSNIKTQRYRRRRRGYEVTLGLLGALGGGGLGLVVAGTAGLGVGIVLGGAAAALGAWATQRQEQEMAERDSQLDIEIGVDDGDIGVPGLEHPPAKVGAFSKEVSGAGSSTEVTPASGPFLRPPDT